MYLAGDEQPVAHVRAGTVIQVGNGAEPFGVRLADEEIGHLVHVGFRIGVVIPANVERHAPRGTVRVVLVLVGIGIHAATTGGAIAGAPGGDQTVAPLDRLQEGVARSRDRIPRGCARRIDGGEHA